MPSLEYCVNLLKLKTYSTVGAACRCLFFVTTLTCIVYTTNLHVNASFSCYPDESVAKDVDKKYYITFVRRVEALCSLKYNQKHNSPVPLHGFVVLDCCLILVVCMIYTYSVKSCVKKYETATATSNDEEHHSLQQGHGQPDQNVQNRPRKRTRTYFTVFNIYVFHLLLCIMVAIVFIVLIFSTHYPTKFSCPWPSSNSNITIAIPCIKSAGLEMTNSIIAVGIVNIFLTVIAVSEICYFLYKIWPDKDFSSDLEFCSVYLLSKRETIRKIIKEYYNEFKQRVVSNMSSLFKIYIHKDEILIEEMFHSRDNDQKFHKILVVGPPGIERSIFTWKSLLHWTEVREFYRGKLAIILKFSQTFNSESCSLKDILKLGIVDEFDALYEYVLQNPERVLLIFDGLDKLCPDNSCLTENDTPNNYDHTINYNSTMPVLLLFKKLVSGEFLPGATTLTIIKPTADHVYSQWGKFDETYQGIKMSYV